MKFICMMLLTFACAFTVLAQSEIKPPDLNLGFEKVSAAGNLPDGWKQIGNGYTFKTDNLEKKSGKYSVLIESSAEKSADSFGLAASGFPANFQGKEIELRGFLKLDNISGGFVGLFMRIDGESGLLQADNMQSRGISGTMNWTEFSIKLPLSENASQITIGAMNAGKGRLWADDLQILIDGKDISEAKMRPLIEYKAKKDKEFDNGSKIDAVKLNASKTNDLTVLGKVWGFLKYYHPAAAAGEYNWDYELFRILPKVLDAKSKKERNKVLSAWVESLGTVKPATAEKNAVQKVKLSPDLVWINEKDLGGKLTEQLNNIKNAKRQTKHYYIGLIPGVGNPQFKNEEAYPAMKFPDAGYRLLSLYRYWNIIQYYNPNKHLIEGGWNKVLPEFVPEFAGAASELEYKKAALALIARIHDTHANIWGQDETLAKFRGVNYAPVGVTFVEDKAVITKIWDQAAGEKSGLKIGDLIEKINDKKVSEIVKEKLNLTPASNYPTQLRDIAGNLLRTNDNPLKIKYRRGGLINETQIETIPKDKMRVYLTEQFNKPIPAFKLISPDIAYLYPGSLKQGEIKEIISKIAGTKGLIVDLRSYPSDFIVFSLGEFLMPKPTAFVKFSNGSIETPGLFTLTDEIPVGKDNADSYKGKVVILINETTQSQAEYTTMALRVAPRAIVVGSTTAGADGNVSQFALPGGISTMISGIGVYYPDGKETQRIGIVPDILVKPTVKGIAAGRDELLEKAIEIVNSK